MNKDDIVNLRTPGTWTTDTEIRSILVKFRPKHSEICLLAPNFTTALTQLTPAERLLADRPEALNKIVVVPFCVQKHWVVVQLDMEKNSCSYYDSLELCDTIVRPAITRFLSVFRKVFDIRNPINPVKVTGCQQQDHHDCGIFTSSYIFALLDGKDPRDGPPIDHTSLRTIWADALEITYTGTRGVSDADLPFNLLDDGRLHGFDDGPYLTFDPLPDVDDEGFPIFDPLPGFDTEGFPIIGPLSGPENEPIPTFGGEISTDGGNRPRTQLSPLPTEEEIEEDEGRGRVGLRGNIPGRFSLSPVRARAKHFLIADPCLSCRIAI